MTDKQLEQDPLPGDALILVGFGKHKLSDVLDWIGTDKEEDAYFAVTKWPPWYREARLCDDEDFSRFVWYTQWAGEITEKITGLEF